MEDKSGKKVAIIGLGRFGAKLFERFNKHVDVF